MPNLFNEITPSFENLRDYQIAVKKVVFEKFQKKDVKSLLIQMPTGSGKTRLFCSVVKDIHNKSIERITDINAEDRRAFKVLLVAHTEELIQQIKANLSNHGLASGVIKSGQPYEKQYQIQVASILTLKKDLERNIEDRTYKQLPDLIIIDEAHHSNAPSYQRLSQFTDAYILGFTATPCRTNGDGLNMFSDIVLGPSIRELIKNKHLVRPRYFSPEMTFNLENVQVNAGDYVDTELAKILNTDVNNKSLVNTYQNYVYGKKGIVYAVNKLHAEKIASCYNQERINAEFIDSDTETIDRRAILKRFEQGITKILVNVKIFTEGYDCPNIDFVQLARPTKSIIMYYQQVGRCLRTSPGKESGYILDNAGLIKEHGLFINEPNWENLFRGTNVNLNQRTRLVEEPYAERRGINNEGVTIQLNEIEIEGLDSEINHKADRNVSVIDFFATSLLDLYYYIKIKEYSESLILDSVKILEKNLYNIAHDNFSFYQEKEKEQDVLFSKKDEYVTELYKINSEIALTTNQTWIETRNNLRRYLRSEEAVLAALKIDYPEIESFEEKDIENLKGKKGEIESDILIIVKEIDAIKDLLSKILEISKEGMLFKELIENELIEHELEINLRVNENTDNLKELLESILVWSLNVENRQREIFYPTQFLKIRELSDNFIEPDFIYEKLNNSDKVNLSSILKRAIEKGFNEKSINELYLNTQNNRKQR